jgi:hypothetical protein
MKKHINPFKGFILLAFALSPLLSMAHDGDNVERKRTISKTYTVGPDDLLGIENSFGNVTVETWDKNTIQVDIEIGVRASSDEKAQQMLDQISVSDHQGIHEIEFKTDIGHMGGKGNNNRSEDNRRFYVDYKISMPSKNPLRIENSFGKTSVPDFAGTASLTSKFGELTTGKITNAKLIHVEFGKAEIGKLTNAEVIFKFNSKSNVAGISGNSKVDVQFCSQVNLSVDNTVRELSVYDSYSTVNLRVSVGLSAQFEVYTNFGSFKNKTAFNISEESEDDNSGPKFDKTYSGTAGSGSAKIKIKSSFGSVRVANENDKSVDKEDKEDKEDDKDDDKDKVNL